jgi:hypothetical protein
LFPAIGSDVIEDIERDDRVERCIGLTKGFTDRRGRDAKLIAVKLARIGSGVENED